MMQNLPHKYFYRTSSCVQVVRHLWKQLSVAGAVYALRQHDDNQKGLDPLVDALGELFYPLI